MDNSAELGIKSRPFDEEKRKQQIDQIIEKDRKAFQEWSIQVGQEPRLDLPPEALRYLMIPKRVLELAEDPYQVRLVTMITQEDDVRVLVIEQRNEPVSNSDSLDQYLNSLKQFHDKEKAKQQAKGQRFYLAPKDGVPVKPSDVDEEHIRYRELIESGTLTINDYVTNHLYLKRGANHQALYVSHYDDRPELRGKGIASSFYQRLPEVKAVGFRFLVGWNEERNVGYFTGKLGRSRINEIKTEYRSLFGATSAEIKGEQSPGAKIRTIQFLYPEDKGKYVNSI